MQSTGNLLADKIKKRTLCLAVLGTGYVGLPTAALFAEAGFNVTAVDVNSEIVEKVSIGNSPIDEPGLQKLVSICVQTGTLRAVLLSQANFDEQDCIVISVPTPIDEEKKPDLSFLMSAIESVGKNLHKGMLVVVCSTVPPNTLIGKVEPCLESLSGLVAEADFYLAYVPERIAPGKAIKELVENTRLAGGIGPESGKVAADLFRSICKNVVITDAITAEISKLAENTFRTINVAFANQLALLCEEYGADVTKVAALANTHPRVNIHVSGPGVGGPCLTKDPYLLIDGVQLQDRDLVSAAGEINNFMSKHVVELVLKGFNRAGKPLKDSHVAVLGAAYKGDVGDSRSSPSQPIVKELLSLGLKVNVFDPFCKTSFGGILVESVSEAVKNADCVLIVTDHSVFKNLDLGALMQLMAKKPVFVDCRRLFDPLEAAKIGFFYYGIGYGNRHTVNL